MKVVESTVQTKAVELGTLSSLGRVTTSGRRLRDSSTVGSNGLDEDRVVSIKVN